VGFAQREQSVVVVDRSDVAHEEEAVSYGHPGETHHIGRYFLQIAYLALFAGGHRTHDPNVLTKGLNQGYDRLIDGDKDIDVVYEHYFFTGIEHADDRSMLYEVRQGLIYVVSVARYDEHLRGQLVFQDGR
jgi:hypothetical protein